MGLCICMKEEHLANGREGGARAALMKNEGMGGWEVHPLPFFACFKVPGWWSPTKSRVTQRERAMSVKVRLCARIA